MCSFRQWVSLKAAASSDIRATKGISFRRRRWHTRRARQTNEALARDHPEIFARIEPAVWLKPWVAQAQGAGRGRTALPYLAAYVKKSAFSEGRLLGYDQTGRIVLSYRDSADGKLKSEALDPLELIRRWLLHLLPKGLVRVRHYGWLSPAAHKAFLRVRFLLGLGPYRIPPTLKSEPPRCPFCNGVLAKIARIAPAARLG